MRRRLIEVLGTFTGVFMVTLTLDPSLFDGDPLRAFEYVKGKKESGNSQHLIGELVRTLWKRGYLHSRRFFCVLECQKNGFPHWHLLLDASFIPIDAIRDRWDTFRPKDAGPVQGNRPAFGAVKFSAPKFADHKHAAHYACKYLIKNPEQGYPDWLLDSSRVHRFTTSKSLFPKADPKPTDLDARIEALTKLALRGGLDPAVVVPQWLAELSLAASESDRQVAEQYGLDPEVVDRSLAELGKGSKIDFHESLAQLASEGDVVAFSKSDGEDAADALEEFPLPTWTIRGRIALCKSRCVLLARDGEGAKPRFAGRLDVSLAELKEFLGREENGNGVPLTIDEAQLLLHEFTPAPVWKGRLAYWFETRVVDEADPFDLLPAPSCDDEPFDATELAVARIESTQRVWEAVQRSEAEQQSPSPEPTGEDPPLQAGGTPAGRQTALACPLLGDDGCDGGRSLDSIDAFHAHLRDVHGVTGDHAWEFQNEAIDDLGDDVSRHRWARAVDEALANLLFDEAADSDERGEAA